MYNNKVLCAAYLNHKKHGPVFWGANYVECKACKFHIHTAGGDNSPGYIHWIRPDSYDKNPVIQVDDPRIS